MTMGSLGNIHMPIPQTNKQTNKQTNTAENRHPFNPVFLQYWWAMKYVEKSISDVASQVTCQATSEGKFPRIMWSWESLGFTSSCHTFMEETLAHSLNLQY
jgi:hypothetical protein